MRAYLFQAALEVMWLPTQILYVFCTIFCTIFREGMVKWHTGQTGPRSQELSQINSVWTALGWNASVSQVSLQYFGRLAQQFAATRLYFWVQSLRLLAFFVSTEKLIWGNLVSYSWSWSVPTELFFNSCNHVYTNRFLIHVYTRHCLTQVCFGNGMWH